MTQVFRLAAAEVRYGAASIGAWLAVLAVASMWPLVESASLSAVPAVFAILALLLPIAAIINAFRLLSVEKNEGRLRQFSTLPARITTVAAARQLRGAVMSLAALVLAASLAIVGVVSQGWQLLNVFEGAWVLATLFVASVALSAFVTLLYDIAGLSFAQIVVAVVAITGFMANAYLPGFASEVIGPVSDMAQTPVGALLMFPVCVVLWAADVAVLLRRAAN